MKKQKRLRHFGRENCSRCGKPSKIFYGSICASCYKLDKLENILSGE